MKTISALLAGIMMLGLRAEAQKEFDLAEMLAGGRYATNVGLEPALSQKTQLIFGGIGPRAVLDDHNSHGCVSATRISEIAPEEALTINYHPKANADLLGDAWQFTRTLSDYPSLQNKLFENISYYHIGDSPWAVHFSPEERGQLLKAPSEQVTAAIRARFQMVFVPVVDRLAPGGNFEYKSFESSFCYFVRSADFQCLTKQLVAQIQPYVERRVYPCFYEDTCVRENYHYDISHVPCSGIFEGHREAFEQLGLENVKVELVATLRPAGDDESENAHKEYLDDLEDMSLRLRSAGDPTNGDHPLGEHIFFRITGTKSLAPKNRESGSGR